MRDTRSYLRTGMDETERCLISPHAMLSPAILEALYSLLHNRGTRCRSLVLLCLYASIPGSADSREAPVRCAGHCTREVYKKGRQVHSEPTGCGPPAQTRQAGTDVSRKSLWPTIAAAISRYGLAMQHSKITRYPYRRRLSLFLNPVDIRLCSAAASCQRALPSTCLSCDLV